MSHRWTDAEHHYLAFIAGDVPWDMLQRRYNDWAACHGYPQRTSCALRCRMSKLGYSETAEGDYVSAGTIHSLLNIRTDTLRRWSRAGRFTAVWQGRKMYVSRAIFKRFAKRHPEYFAGAPYDSLYMLFGSEELATKLSELKMYRPGWPRPVRCIDNGKVYPSAAEAAAAIHVAKSVIHKAIKKNHRSGGMRWEYVL